MSAKVRRMKNKFAKHKINYAKEKRSQLNSKMGQRAANSMFM